jgi:hypothetical protein
MPYHHELTMSQETATPPRIKITWLIGTLAAFAIFAIIGGYSSRMTWNYSDYDQQRADQRYQTLAGMTSRPRSPPPSGLTRTRASSASRSIRRWRAKSMS